MINFITGAHKLTNREKLLQLINVCSITGKLNIKQQLEISNREERKKLKETEAEEIV